MPGREHGARRVLFVCTRNSARSQLAAALWQQVSEIPSTSAGTHPADRIAQGAIDVARRHGVDLADLPPRRLDEVADEEDFVVTVCDNAHEELPGPGRDPLVRAGSAAPEHRGRLREAPSLTSPTASTTSHPACTPPRTATGSSRAQILTSHQFIVRYFMHRQTSMFTSVQRVRDATSSNQIHHPTDSRRNPVSTETAKKPSVLFVCVHNAGRSQMAAAFLTTLGEGRIEVRSAGSAARRQGQPGRRRGHGRTRHRHVRRDPQDPHHRGRQGIRRRDHHGLRRRLPVSSPASATRTGTSRTRPARASTSVRPIRDEIKARIEDLIASLTPPPSNPTEHQETFVSADAKPNS